MADVATLGLSVESSQVKKGARDLDQLTNSAKRAEAATSGVSASTRNAGAAAASLAAETGHAAAGLNRQAAAAKQVSAAMVAANSNARRMGGSFSGLASQFQDIGVTAAADMNPVIIGLQQGAQIAGQMEMAMASGASAVGVLGTAFKSLFSPVTFISIALTTLAALGLQMVNWAGLASSALHGLADVLVTIAPYAAGAAAGLALMYAPAILGGIISTATSIGAVAGAVKGLAVAIYAVVGLPALLVAGFVAMVAAANIFRDELTGILGVDIVGAAKTGVNFIIGSFVAAFHDIQFIWNQLPNIVGAAAVGAANAAIGAIQSMINAAAGMLDSLIDKVNGALAKLPGGFSIGKIGSVDFGQIANPFADALGKANAAHASQIQSDLSQDYLGGFGGAIAKGASAASGKLKELAGWITTVDEKAKKKRGGGGKTDAEKYSDIVDGANRRIAALKAEQAGLGQTEEEALRLKYTQDLLNQAQQKGITLTAAQKAELVGLAGEMAHVEVATRAAKAMQDAWNEAGKSFGGVLKGLLDGTTSWKEALQQTIPIVLKLLNDMAVAQGSKGIFGGGFFQSLVGGLLGVGFANGGVFQNGAVTAFAHGGVVNTPTVFPMARGMGLMGEAGPEAVMPLKRGPDGRLGVQAASGSQPLRLEIVSRFDADGGFETAVEKSSRPIARQESAAATGKLAKSVPAMVDARNDERQTRRLRPRGAI